MLEVLLGGEPLEVLLGGEPLEVLLGGESLEVLPGGELLEVLPGGEPLEVLSGREGFRILPGGEALKVGLGRKLGVPDHHDLVEGFGMRFRLSTIDARRFELAGKGEGVDSAHRHRYLPCSLRSGVIRIIPRYAAREKGVSPLRP